MTYIAILDSENGLVIVKQRGLSEGAEQAFERICAEEGLSASNCQWQEVNRILVDF